MASFSCNEPHRHNEITKIELTRTGAWADIGAIIKIDTSLNYDYWGRYDTVKEGYFTGRISQGFWDTLNYKFDQLKYKTLDTTDNSNVQDANYFELIIHWEKGRRRIIRVDTGGNYPLIKTLKWLNDSYKNVQLKRATNPIKFETTYLQTLIKIDQVKFPPPIIKRKYKRIAN